MCHGREQRAGRREGQEVKVGEDYGEDYAPWEAQGISIVAIFEKKMNNYITNKSDKFFCPCR